MHIKFKLASIVSLTAALSSSCASLPPPKDSSYVTPLFGEDGFTTKPAVEPTAPPPPVESTPEPEPKPMVEEPEVKPVPPEPVLPTVVGNLPPTGEFIVFYNDETLKLPGREAAVSALHETYQDPFLSAVAADDAQTVAAMLTKTPSLMSKQSTSGNFPLHVAIDAGALESFKVLLRYKADVNQKNTAGQSPIDLAFSQNDEPAARMAELLIKFGSERSQEVASRNYLFPPVEARIVDTRAENDYTALHFAAQNGDQGILSLLIKQLAGVNAVTNRGESPLYLAAKSKRVNAANTLMAARANTEIRDATTRATPLHAAITVNDNAAMIAALIKGGADLDARNIYGNTPLMLAAIYNFTDVQVRPLLRGNPNVNSVNIYGDTPLLEAVKRHNVKLAAELLKNHASPILKNKFGDSPASVAESQGGEMADLLNKYAGSSGDYS